MKHKWVEADWISFLRFCDKYEVLDAKEIAVDRLDSHFTLRFSHRLLLAHLYHIDKWVDEAIQYLLAAPDEDFTVEDYLHLPPQVMFQIQHVRAEVRRHTFWLQSKVPPCVHIQVGIDRCFDQTGCEKDWDSYWRAAVLWLIHPIPKNRRTGTEVRESFVGVDIPSFRRPCLNATLAQISTMNGLVKDSVILREGVSSVQKSLPR